MMLRMGRPPTYPDRFLVRLPPETLDRARLALRDGEALADLVRDAIERELRRRGARKNSVQKPSASAAKPRKR